MIRKANKVISAVLAALIALSAVMAQSASFPAARAASWNGTNYGGGSVSGYRTFLDAFGIDYDVYMNWMKSHENDSYYLGTPYVAYDHRNPRGDCGGAHGELDIPGQAALNCTGFVWHVLYKAAVLSGASRSQINSLPVMGNVTPTWSRLGVYRVYFRTKEEALRSGILEKGDLLWIYGTKDCHNAIFYGDSPSHDKFWHSAGPNSFGRIDAPGDFLGMWVAKVTQPDNIELHINASGKSNMGSESFGTKYSIFTSRSDASAAQNHPSDMTIWDRRIGTIVLNSSGFGCLRKADAPSKAELWYKGVSRTNHSYFDSDARKVNAKNTYYAVQWSSAPGMGEDDRIYELSDSGKRTPSGYKIYSANVSKRTATPDFSDIKSTADGVKLSWNSVKGADKYRIYYKNSRGGWTRMSETASTSYTDSDVRLGGTYTYTIRCVDKNGSFISDFRGSGRKHTYTGISTPKLTNLTSENEGIRLKWNPVSGAAKYRLYYINKNGDWSRLGETASTEFLDNEVSAGNSYTYTIRCLNKNGKLVSDYVKSGWKHTFAGIAQPKLQFSDESEGVRLSWNAVSGASKYRLYYLNKNGDWARLGETASTEFLDKEVSAGKTYTYTIRCLNSKGYTNSDYERSGSKHTFAGIAAPQVSYIAAEAEGIRLSWNDVPGATKYRVYIKNENGDWNKIGETSSSSFFSSGLDVGKTYTFTVRCLNSIGYTNSGFDSSGRSCRYDGIAAPHITKLESLKSGVRISWNKVDGARLYRVFYKGKTGWKRLGDTTSLSITDADVTRGGYYTYTVRCVGESGSYISSFEAGSSIIYM